jgi:hypothetical protein
VFFVSGLRVSRRVWRVDVFGRGLFGLAQVGRVPDVGVIRIRGQAPIVVYGTEYRASAVPAMLAGAGVALPLTGRTRIRIDAADTRLSYRDPQVGFSRHNLQLTTGLTVDLQPMKRASEALDAVQPNTSLGGWEWGLSVAASATNQPGTLQTFISIDLRRGMTQRARWALVYAPAFVPFGILSNLADSSEQVVVSRVAVGVFNPTSRSPAVGVGGSPFGIEIQTRGSSWKLYGSAAIGGIWFRRRVPDAGGRAFNYTFEFGAGIQREFAGGGFIRAGYKFHHLSNDFTAPLNPGIVGHCFVLGFGFH